MKIIWVATTGNDLSGTGSQTAPYLTIERALLDFVSGDQIRLLDGTYTPIDTIEISGKSGSIFSENPLGACIQPQKTTTHQAAIWIRNCTRFTIQGIKVLQASRATGNNIGIYAESVSNLVCYTCEVSDFAVTSGSCYGIYGQGTLGRIESCHTYDLVCSDQKVIGIYSVGLDVIDCTVEDLSGAGTCEVFGIKQVG